MAIQMDRVLQEVVGSDRFKHPDSDINSASWIARLIRNAFAHNPFNPTWQTCPECDNKVFEVEGIIRLRTKGLNGRRMEMDDYGGPLSLFRLSGFIRMYILREI
jgi:hypothetical protein